MAQASITWMGQMSLWVRMGGTTLSIDYFASDIHNRQVPPPVPAAEVRGIDYFIGTHDHDDHIDHPAWKICACCPSTAGTAPATAATASAT